MFLGPSRESTPSERGVLVLFISAACIILGLVAVVMAFCLHTKDEALATEVLFKGLGAIGIGLAIFAIFWLYHRLTD